MKKENEKVIESFEVAVKNMTAMIIQICGQLEIMSKNLEKTTKSVDSISQNVKCITKKIVAATTKSE